MPNHRGERGEAEKRAEELLRKVLVSSRDKISKKTWARPYRKMEGYIVKGQRGKYFIEENSLNVYTCPEGKRICIEDVVKNAPHLDKLVARILVLLNDKKFADKIFTLNEV